MDITKKKHNEQSSNINNTCCCNKVCKILQDIGVPNDIEWRSTINFLRTISENRKYNNEQKKKLQDILQKFIYENKNSNYNNYSDKKLQEIKDQIDNIINNNNTSVFLSYLKDLENSYLKINELLSNIINEYDKIIIEKNTTSYEKIEDIKKIQNNTNFYNKEIQSKINNNININNSNFQNILKEMFNNFALSTNNLIKKIEDDIKKLEQKHENTDKWKNIAENLEILASTDCLTGLLNKRIFLNYIEEITINIFNFLNKIIFKEIIDFHCCIEKNEIYQSFINFSNQIYHHQKIKTIEENINSNKNTQKWIEFIKNTFLLNSNIADDLHSVTIIMIDIDNFKKINDNYGHITGDEVLKFISNLIVKNTSENSKVFRYGGEEIIIIYKNTDIHMILDEMENIRTKIANYPFKIRYKLFQYNDNNNEKKSDILKITVSMGVFCINNINIIEIIKSTNYFEIINKYFINIIKNNMFDINNTINKIKNLKGTEKINLSNHLLNDIITNFSSFLYNNNQNKLLENIEKEKHYKLEGTETTETEETQSDYHLYQSEYQYQYQSEYQFAMQSFIYKVIDTADALMYKSKKAGKNCIHSSY